MSYRPRCEAQSGADFSSKPTSISTNQFYRNPMWEYETNDQGSYDGQLRNAAFGDVLFVPDLVPLLA